MNEKSIGRLGKIHEIVFFIFLSIYLAIYFKYDSEYLMGKNHSKRFSEMTNEKKFIAYLTFDWMNIYFFVFLSMF